MILENEKKHVISGDNFNTIKSKVNKDKLAKLYGILSHIYRNPIGSIIREYVSNAIDANNEAHHFKELNYYELSLKYPWILKEQFNMDENTLEDIKKHLTKAGKNEPILISISPSKDELRITDFGVGLSPERMMFIYFNYLDSTKEETDEQIGAFGIGSKSGLAYTHTFFIDTVYNGKKYHYIMTKDESGIPEGNLLNVVEDDSLDNGTTIRIPIKSGEAAVFEREIHKQLLYVDNAYFTTTDNFVDESNSFNSNYIVDGGNWKVAKDSPVNEMHICYNNILYTIDWSELNMTSINVPIGLVFKTGELQPTPSRESIVYSSNSIKLIKERISEVTEYFRERKEKEYDEEISIYEYFNNDFSSSYRIDDNITINLASMNISTSNYNFKIRYFDDIPNYNYNLLSKYQAKIMPYKIVSQMSYYNHQLKHSDNDYSLSLNSSYINSSYKYILLDKGEKISRAKAHYILSKSGGSSLKFIRKDDFDLDYYKSTLMLGRYPKNLWRKIIIAYQKSQQEEIDKLGIEKYSDFLMNPNWYKDYKAGLTPYKKATLVESKKKENIDDVWISYKNCGNDGVFRREGDYVKDLRKIKGIVLYESYDNEPLIKSMRNITKYKPGLNVTLISVSNTNVRRMEKLELKNCYNLQNYLDNKKNKLIPNIITATECKNLLYNLKYSSIVLDYNTVLKKKRLDIDNYIKSNGAYNVTTYVIEEFKEILGDDAIIQEKIDEVKDFIQQCYFHPILEFINDRNVLIDYRNMFVIPEFLISIGMEVDNHYKYLKTEQKLNHFYENSLSYEKKDWQFINDV